MIDMTFLQPDEQGLADRFVNDGFVTAPADDRSGLDRIQRRAAELATDYFSLRGADATALLLEDAVQVYDRALELTKNRYQGGIAAATDVDQAETQRQVTRAQLASVRLQRAQYSSSAVR